MPEKLEKLRKEIDRIDHEIVDLINQRYSMVVEVGRWKEERNLPVYVPEREKQLLDKLRKFNNGPMLDESLLAIYREIISGARKLENPMKIAFFGPVATNTHQAAVAQFGHGADYVACNSIADVFGSVESGHCDYGCVPIENSIEGTVNHTLDMFVDSGSKICAEILLKIHHCLLSTTSKENIKKIYSHVQVFGQCRSWLLQNMPHADLIEVSSTSKAAAMAKNDPEGAALAGTLAAELHELNILERNIEDFGENVTRFMVIGKHETQSTGRDKTSLCMAIGDRVGGLYDCLYPFKKEKINLTMIESRPTKRKNWDYCFFIDLEGHCLDEKIKTTLDELREICSFVKVLGSYPNAEGLIK